MRAKRSLGQNFLVSETAIGRILEVCRFMSAEAGGVVEVGPGQGALTAGLAGLGKPLWLVEMDGELARELEARFPEAQVTVADARTFDWCSLGRVSGLHPWLMVGNLPYNAGTDILRGALFRRDSFCGAVVMLQREVAEKFCAGAGEERYGPLGAWADPWWERRILFTVPPGAFRPQPKVTSAVCAFRARAMPGLPSSTMFPFWEFLQRCFRHRRKALLSNLLQEPRDRESWSERMEAEGLEPLLRPGQITPEQYAALFSGSP